MSVLAIVRIEPEPRMHRTELLRRAKLILGLMYVMMSEYASSFSTDIQIHGKLITKYCPNSPLSIFQAIKN